MGPLRGPIAPGVPPKGALDVVGPTFDFRRMKGARGVVGDGGARTNETTNTKAWGKTKRKNAFD